MRRLINIGKVISCMVFVCGIDEAGRGPIIGPLVLCGVVIEEGKESRLTDLGVKDSKLLTPAQRSRIAKVLEKEYKFHRVVVPAAEIDSAVEKNDGLNLNWLEAKKAADIINALKPDKVVVDCPSNNPKAYTSYLRDLLNNKKAELVCVHHADRDFPVVGAASILAKVERDRLIDELKKKIKVDFGSGYISDPKTKVFVDKFWNKFPEIFRHSWAPYKSAVAKGAQAFLSDEKYD